MNEDEFLRRIYGELEIGMPVQTPTRQTDIKEIRPSGDIVYEITGGYQKVLSRKELCEVYRYLSENQLERWTLSRIVPRSRTTNVATITWILSRLNLAIEQADRSWVRTW